MARKIYYKIIDDGNNTITDDEWESILRLQHWYNSEFIWTAGRLGFKMFVVFPNVDSDTYDPYEIQNLIRERYKEQKKFGLSWNQIIKKLYSEGLIILLKGGYLEGCLASGCTRVADNEFNAYLVCDFLLKSSKLAPNANIDVFDEGEFIKTKNIQLNNGTVKVKAENKSDFYYFRMLVKNKHIFSVVNPTKYDNHPELKHTITNFNELTLKNKKQILSNWNWLGFNNNFDDSGDDFVGFDLNKKVENFELV